MLSFFPPFSSACRYRNHCKVHHVSVISPPIHTQKVKQNSQDKLIHQLSPKRPFRHPNRNTPRTNQKLAPPLRINHNPPRTPPQQVRPHFTSVSPPHTHPLDLKLPTIRHNHRQSIPVRSRRVPEASEAHARRFIEVVDLCTVGPVFPGKHHLR